MLCYARLLPGQVFAFSSRHCIAHKLVQVAEGGSRIYPDNLELPVPYNAHSQMRARARRALRILTPHTLARTRFSAISRRVCLRIAYPRTRLAARALRSPLAPLALAAAHSCALQFRSRVCFDFCAAHACRSSAHARSRTRADGSSQLYIKWCSWRQGGTFRARCSLPRQRPEGDSYWGRENSYTPLSLHHCVCA